MAIPDYESLMLPLLSKLADGQTRVLKDVMTESPRDSRRLFGLSQTATAVV